MRWGWVAPLAVRGIRLLKRCCQGFFLAIALYLLTALIGLIPVNNDFAPTADGVEIMVASNSVHADLILPLRNDIVDWSRNLPASDFSGRTHIAFGWGSKEFYIETPTWADVKIGTVFRALLWPSQTCVRANLLDDESIPSSARKTTISREQYSRLVEYVNETFQRDANGELLLIPGAGSSADEFFFDARGSYHAFNTCNCWVGGGLKTAGVRTGWYTPLPGTVSWYMPATK